MKYRDIIVGAVFCIIALVYFKESFFETNNLTRAQYGPQFMPRIYAVALLVLNLALIIQGIGKLKKNQEPSEEQKKREWSITQALPVIFSILLIAVYIFLIEKIGFLIATIFYLFFQAMILAKKKNYMGLILFAVITAAVIYFLFVKLLNVQLPSGIFI